MRLIYGIEVLERNYKTDEMEIVYTKFLPHIPVKEEHFSSLPELKIKDIEKYIDTLDAPWWKKEVMRASVFFTTNIQYPKHPYKISLVSWKYN